MIPKVIYMCHKRLDEIRIYSKNWKALNPEYDIQLYDDERCKQFLLNEYSQLYRDIFNFIKDGPIKSDFWRLCIIQKYGGLYVDADIHPLVPLRSYIEENDDFVTCISTNFVNNRCNTQLNPHFLLSNKNNVILRECIDKYVHYYTEKIPYTYWDYSICLFLEIKEITQKKSHVLYARDQKIKLLCEQNYTHCEYNGVVVLNNRYPFYKNHNFFKIPKKIPTVHSILNKN